MCTDYWQYNLGDYIKVIKDTNPAPYSQNNSNKHVIGKTFEIVNVRGYTHNGEPTEYKYGIYTNLGLTFVSDEEIEPATLAEFEREHGKTNKIIINLGL